MNKEHFEHLHTEIKKYAESLMEQERQDFENEHYTLARECSSKLFAVNHILDMITLELISEYTEENKLIV